MIYFINFLAVAAIPLAIGRYGAHLAAKILDIPDRRKASAIIWLLAALGCCCRDFNRCSSTGLIAFRNSSAWRCKRMRNCRL